MKHTLGRLLAGVLLAGAIAAPTAYAAEVTVNLRVEGAAGTLYEGQVTTDAIADLNGHPCNFADNGDLPGGIPQPTPTTAVHSWASAAAVVFDAPWNATYNEHFVSQIGPDVNGSVDPFPYWGVAVNNVPLEVGGCQRAIHSGDSVLWAYGVYGDALLTLSGPSAATAGQPVQFVVRNGINNVGVAGATVAGATTDANGIANVTFTTPGAVSLKAEKPGAIRSNAVTVNVVAAAGAGGGVAPAPAPEPAPAPAPAAPTAPSGSAPPADATRPVVKVAGLRDKQRFKRSRAPRELKGSVVDEGGVRQVKLRLVRRRGEKVRRPQSRRTRVVKRCSTFSGSRERFRPIRCGGPGSWFAVGDTADWSYLMPARLGRGRYVLSVKATDTAGNASSVQRLRFRVR
jgi:hypothetical protein